MKKSDHFLLGFLCGIATALIGVLVLVSVAGCSKVDKMDNVSYIEHCAKTGQMGLATVLVNYESAKLLGCKREFAKMTSEYIELKLIQTKKEGRE